MRILWVAPYSHTEATHGGKLRLGHLVAACEGAGHEVMVCSFGTESLPARSRSGPWGKVQQVVSRLPEAAWTVTTRRGREQLSDLAGWAEIVIIEQSHVAAYASLFSNLPIVYDSQNFEPELIGELAKLAPSRRSQWRFKFDAWKTRILERDLLTKVSALCVVSAEDLARYQTWYGKDRLPRAYIVPNGVDSIATPWTPPSSRVGARMLMTGSLGYWPNLHAAIRLIDRILPRVRERLADVELWLVGSRPPASLLRRAASEQGVEVYADVPDVRPFLEQADIFVCPLPQGGGSRLKVYEAAAAGLPIVATQEAMEGSGIDKYVRIGTTDQQLADQCIELLLAADERLRLSMAGRRIVEREFDWSVVTKPLLRALASLSPVTGS